LSTFSFQAPPPAPGRDGPSGPSNAAPTSPGTPGTTAPADAPSGGGAASNPMMLLMVLLPVLLLMMTMRGQTKKQKQVESSLKTGDTVVTNSGMIGKVTEMTELRVKIEIAPGVSVRMLKSAISGIDAGEAKPDASKTSGDAPVKDKSQEKKA
jgi:preprotein translocase subunit YajC